LRSSTKHYNPIIMRYMIVTLLALSTTVLAAPGVAAIDVKVGQISELTYYWVQYIVEY